MRKPMVWRGLAHSGPSSGGVPPSKLCEKTQKTPRRSAGGGAVEILTAPGSRGSITKLLVAIFCHGLLVMASLTQRLPVVGVPEQLLVAAVWNDVINHSGLDQSALCLTPSAQGVRVEERCAGLLPAATVSLLGGGLGVVRVERSMLLAVRLTVGNQPTAARVLAWGVGSARHGQLPPPVF